MGLSQQVITGAISPVSGVILIYFDYNRLITLLTKSHEPSSKGTKHQKLRLGSKLRSSLHCFFESCPARNLRGVKTTILTDAPAEKAIYSDILIHSPMLS